MTFVDPDLPDHLEGDPVRLRQILVNLAGNALKFTEKGFISIEVVSERPAAEGEIGSLVFRVADTGIGITEDQKERLFQPFTQADTSTVRRFGGTGLGLSICRALVDLMGGEIGVDSVPGRGSTFWFRLSLKVRLDRRKPPERDLSDVRVLVATTSAPFGDALRRYLFCHQARTTVAVTGETALTLLKRHAGTDQAFNLLLADSDLVDMSGRALTGRVVEESALAGLRTILFTPRAGPLPSDVGAGSTVYATLTKPVKREIFCRTVAAAAGREVPEDDRLPGRRETDPNERRDFTPPSIEEARAAGALILVAEDNPTNQTVIRMLLDRLGYACELEINGRNAWLRLQAKSYGLLLTDCHMPEMDGYQLSSRVREAEQTTGRHLPILALTADALVGTAQKCRDAGMDDYLKKPIAREQLERALKKWLPQAEALRCPAQDRSAAKASVSAPVPAPTPAPEVPPILDLSYLRQELGVPDEMIGELLKDFVNTTRPVLDGLADSLAAGDFEAARKQAHAAAGASKTAGAKRLGQVCSEIERAIVEGDTARALTRAGSVGPALAELLAALET